MEDSQIEEVITSMFQQAGMAHKETLTFEDFNRLLRDYKDQLDHANLNFSGWCRNFMLVFTMRKICCEFTRDFHSQY